MWVLVPAGSDVCWDFGGGLTDKAAWGVSLHLASVALLWVVLLFEHCVNSFNNFCRQEDRVTTVFVKMEKKEKQPTWKPYLSSASGICYWSKKLRVAIKYLNLCACERWMGCGWAGEGVGAVGSSGASQLWASMDRRNGPPWGKDWVWRTSSEVF